MSENKKNIKMIGPNSFLFSFNQEAFYFLSFEVLELLKVKIILIKMLKTETYVFETIVPFNALGTNDPSPQDALQSVTYLICNNDFSIKEEMNKIILFINSINKASIQILSYDKNNESNKDSAHKVHLNNMQSRIQELLSKISMQDQKINELKKRRENHEYIINKAEEITNQINIKLDKEEANKNKNQYNNNNNQYNNNYNPYNTNNNNNNPYNPYNTNNNFQYSRSTTQINNNNYNFNNLNNNNNINFRTTINKVYSGYLPDNTNVNNLLTRQEFRGSMPVQKMEKRRTINLDNIGNYRP